MIQVEARVTESGHSGPFVQIVFEAPGITDGLSPGRFALADLAGWGGYLRTPLFPAFLEGRTFWVLVSSGHPAAALRPGAQVNLIGPLGRGFEVDTTVRRLLLVADVAHLPVLLPLAVQTPEVSQTSEVSVALVLSAPTAADLYPVHLLPSSVEVHVVTADGSAGQGGSIPDLFPDLVRWADCVCIAADPASYPALADSVRQVRIMPERGRAAAGLFAQALVMPPMVCGVGACQGCAVQVVDGFKLACADGPVFDLLELR